jgi:hypothetical protein
MNDPRIKINLDTPSQDQEGNGRESKELKRGLTFPAIKTHAWPHMSDAELYLRINVPDGLENDGKQPEHYGIVPDAHADPSVSPIRSDSGR